MLKINKTSLSLSLNNIDQREFNFVWLRDNCQCDVCLHPSTHERTLITSEIPDDIAPIDSNIDEDNLSIIWNDKEHKSYYSLDWLNKHQNNKETNTCSYVDPAMGELKLWDNSLEGNIPTFNYIDLREDNSALLAWCEAIRDVGLTIVRGAPTVEGEIERFAEHVAYVRETIYDRLHNVRATPNAYNAYNVASTSLELKPHTDMPNYNNPPGVQMFHFLVNEAEGGMSTAVDGFNIARLLKEQDSDAYKTLTEILVPFRMDSARGDIFSANPLLTLDTTGNLKVFRFSNQLAQSLNLSADKMEAFYHAYRLIGRLIEDPDNMVKFRLNTSDMMATNNLRVMHGRTSYDVNSGNRHLQLSYMDYDDVLSRIRMIKKGQLNG
ncbi:MAG: gamma-butyrobetaine dioxygenase [Cocleimonas sp.]|jgi:gamma-butyrobetaine dioxygenase